jgi:hypothetical protein
VAVLVDRKEVPQPQQAVQFQEQNLPAAQQAVQAA